jgi:hypothetical protein
VADDGEVPAGNVKLEDVHLLVTARVVLNSDKKAYSGRKHPPDELGVPMPDLVTTILAKALVMVLQALLARLFMQFMRSGLYRDLSAAGAA